MRQTKRWILRSAVVIIMLTICLGAISQSASIDLKKSIETALANNNSLKADSMNLLTTSYQNKALKADFLPQVNYSSKSEYNIANPVQLLPGSFIGQNDKEFVPVQFGTDYSMTNSIEVTQNIIRKSTRVQINAAGLNNSIAQTRHTLTKEDLIYQVATTYYSLQTNAEMIRSTTKDYQNIREIVRIAKVQFENGVLKRIDYESLQINAANKESQLNQLQTNYTEQLSWFKYLLGIPANTDITIDGSLPVVTTTIQEQDQALWNRTDIHLARQMIESKEVDIKSIKAEYQPTLSSYFRFNYTSQFNDFSDAMNHDNRYKSSVIGLSASIPIFDGNRRRNRLHVAESQLLQLKFKREQQVELAKTEWVTANETLKLNRQQYNTNEQNLLLAEKVFLSRKALYAEGVSSLIELLDAEKELTQARNNYIQSMINVQTGMVNVHKAKGTLLTDFIKSL